MRRRIYCAAALVDIMLAALGTSHAQTPPAGQTAEAARQLVFTHVTVIDATGAPAQPDMNVVISGDRITSIGKSGKIRIPQSAQVVDTAGKYMIPGLWDMHVHLLRHTGEPLNEREYFFPLMIANGVTSVRDMWTKLDQVEQIRLWRKLAIESPGSVPRIAAIGTLLDGEPPNHPGSDVITTADEARGMVDKLKAGGVDFVKVYWRLPREAYFAIVDESRKQGIPFAGHVPIAVSAWEASDAGQRSIEHLDSIALACSSQEKELRNVKDWNPKYQKQMLETFDEAKCAQLFSRFKRNGTWQTPTLVEIRRRTWQRMGRSLGNEDRLKYIPPADRERWTKIGSEFAPRSAEQKENPRNNWELSLRLVGELYRAGVQIMAGTDVGNAYVYPGFGLHDELALLVEAGMPPMYALQAATRNPAKYLGVLDSIGTVEQGKLADLVLLEANPLENIANTQRIAAVVMNGKLLSRESLDKILAAAQAPAK
jgi:hypothetical protein